MHKHVTHFDKRLDNDQTTLVRSDITISNKDKLQFYLEQMYDSNLFDKSEMMKWKQQDSATKTDYNLTKNYFETLVKLHDTYTQNCRGGTAKGNNCNSANNMADIGNKIKDYIAKIAGTSVSNNKALANMCEAAKGKDAELTAMAAQIKLLISAITKFTPSQPNSDNQDPNKRGGRERREPEQLTKLCNMGG